MTIHRSISGFKSGISTTELMVVVICFSLILAYLFLTAGRGRRGSDKSANILNIRNCQQAMRGVEGMEQLSAGDPFTRKDLEEFMLFPTSPNRQITYTTDEKVTPPSADPATDWSHIWLIPTEAGLPGGKYGHDSYEDVTGW